MRTWLFYLMLALVFCFAVKPALANNKSKKAADYKIMLILSGPINDKSWNASNYSGLVKCNKTLGTKMEFVENVQHYDYKNVIQKYAEEGYDLIIAAGTQFDEATNMVAPDYPDTVFCVVNGFLSKDPNVAPIVPKEYEAAYLAGIIAGEVSTGGQFGTIGGYPTNSMVKLLDVYETTAVKIARDRGFENSKAVRAYSFSWVNMELGQKMTENMIDKGVDLMFVYARHVGGGAIKAVRERGIQFIGFSTNQEEIALDGIVATIVFDFEAFYVWAMKKFLDGNLSGNTVHQAGIKEDIFYPGYGPSITTNVKDILEIAINEVKEGKITFDDILTKDK